MESPERRCANVPEAKRVLARCIEAGLWLRAGDGHLGRCMRRAKANGAATQGLYKAAANGAGRDLKHTESLHEKDYKY